MLKEFHTSGMENANTNLPSIVYTQTEVSPGRGSCFGTVLVTFGGSLQHGSCCTNKNLLIQAAVRARLAALKMRWLGVGWIREAALRLPASSGPFFLGTNCYKCSVTDVPLHQAQSFKHNSRQASPTLETLACRACLVCLRQRLGLPASR